MSNCSLPKCYPVSLDNELVVENFENNCTDWDIVGTGIGGTFMNNCRDCRIEGNFLRASCPASPVISRNNDGTQVYWESSLNLDACYQWNDSKKLVVTYDYTGLHCFPAPPVSPPAPPTEASPAQASLTPPVSPPVSSPVLPAGASPTQASLTPPVSPPVSSPVLPAEASPAQASLIPVSPPVSPVSPAGASLAQASLTPPLVSPSSDSNFNNGSLSIKKQNDRSSEESNTISLDVNTLMYVGIAVFLLLIMIVIKKK